MLDARDFTVRLPDQRASVTGPYADAGLAIVDEHGRLAYVSQTFAVQAGYERREQLLGVDWIELYLPDERARLREIASRLGPDGRWSGDACGLRRDGNPAPQRLSLTGLPRDRLLCIAWPRSAPPGETGSAAAAVPEGDALLVSVLNRITAARIRLDAERRFVEVSPQAERLLRRPRTALLGRPAAEIFSAESSQDFARQCRRAVEEQTPVAFEAFYQPLNAWFEVIAYPVGQQLAVHFRDITERKEAEQERGRLASHLQAILDATSDGVFGLDPTGRCTFVNRSGAALLGYEPHELLGQVLHEMIWEPSPASGSSSGAACPILRAFRERRETRVDEATLRRRDGRTFPAELSACPVVEAGAVTGVVLTVKDMTERVQVTEALRRREQEFEALVEHAPDVIARVDRSYRVLYVNPAIERLAGLRPTSVIGKTARECGLPTPLARSWTEALDEVFATGREREVTLEWTARDGIHRCEARLTPEFGADGSVTSVLVVGRETTEEERTKALLASERHVLELIARGAALPTVLETLVRTIEQLSPGAICSILLLDGDRRLRHGAAPHLPPAYAAAIDGLAVGPDSGSCGAAAYYREPVVTADIASDPRWSRGRALALRHGLRACWSFPILATDGEVLGTFAIYFLAPRAPRPHDWQVIEVATHLAGIALERRRAEESLRKSTATLQGIINSGRQSIVVIGPDYRIQAFNDLALVSIKRGWGREIRVGDSLLDHLAGADRREIERIVPQVLAGQPIHREWRIPDRAGRAHWFELHFDPVRDHHGGVMAVCITAWPIDERKRAEEERARLFAREHAARTAAEAAHRRAALLAETSRVFVEASLDVHASFATIARQIADRLGDACVIRILDDDGRSLVPVASYHPDPATLGQLRDLLAKSPLGWGEGLQGRVASSGRPLLARIGRLGHVRAWASAAFWNEVRRLGICSLAITPIRARGRVIGTVLIARLRSGEPYTADDLLLLEDLAARAALAIDNTTLYRRLAERERRLQELVSQILVAQEEERRRVAYDVHDGLAQIAAGAHQHLQAFAHRHAPASPEARRELERALDLARRTVNEARRIVADLRPTALDDFGLAAAIRLEVNELRADGWQVRYEESLGAERLPPAVETALYRVAQEALTNVRKHAQTTAVRVGLTRGDEVVRLEVRDRGRGFDPEAARREPRPGFRIGLDGMRERVTSLGGRFAVESRPGAGTRVVAEVPVRCARGMQGAIDEPGGAVHRAAPPARAARRRR